MGTPAYYYSSTAGSYTLTGAATSSATSITLNSVTGLPSNTPYKMVLDPGGTAEEIVKVTAIAGTTLTVTRGWDGSSATSHTAGATARHMMTAEDLTLSRSHEAQSSAHGVTGSVVGTSDTQTLSNKTLVTPTVSGVPVFQAGIHLEDSPNARASLTPATGYTVQSGRAATVSPVGTDFAYVTGELVAPSVTSNPSGVQIVTPMPAWARPASPQVVAVGGSMTLIAGNLPTLYVNVDGSMTLYGVTFASGNTFQFSGLYSLT